MTCTEVLRPRTTSATVVTVPHPPGSGLLSNPPPNLLPATRLSSLTLIFNLTGSRITGDKLPGMSVREDLDEVDLGGKTYPKMWGLPSHGWWSKTELNSSGHVCQFLHAEAM